VYGLFQQGSNVIAPSGPIQLPPVVTLPCCCCLELVGEECSAIETVNLYVLWEPMSSGTLMGKATWRENRLGEKSDLEKKVNWRKKPDLSVSVSL
jgi:hypothetical protein